MELAAHSTKILSNHLGRSNDRLWYFQEFLTWRAVMFSVSVHRRNGPLHWVWPSLSVHAIRYFNKLISRLSRWSPTFHQFSCIFTVIRGTYRSFSQDIPTVILATETKVTHGHVSTALKHIFRSRFSFFYNNHQVKTTTHWFRRLIYQSLAILAKGAQNFKIEH